MKVKEGIKRTPVKKKSIYENKKAMLRWKLMREAERKRTSLQRQKKREYTIYKNDWFTELLSEATKIRYWTQWDTFRIKRLRLLLEREFKIPINLYSAFVYFATYKYLHWNGRQRDFSNYIGFIYNENTRVSFANYVASKSFRWRRKNNRWPDDYLQKWGIKTSYKGQKLGYKDKFVKYDIMSKEVEKKINRFL